jgi:hypothetical protein
MNNLSNEELDRFVAGELTPGMPEWDRLMARLEVDPDGPEWQYIERQFTAGLRGWIDEVWDRAMQSNLSGTTETDFEEHLAFPAKVFDEYRELGETSAPPERRSHGERLVASALQIGTGPSSEKIPSYRVEIPLEACDWRVGSCAGISLSAIVEVSQPALGPVTVSVGGFLMMDRNVLLEITWRDATGTIIETGKPSNPFIGLVELQAGPNRTVQAGDRFCIRYSRIGPEGPCDLQFTIEIPKEGATEA